MKLVLVVALRRRDHEERHEEGSSVMACLKARRAWASRRVIDEMLSAAVAEDVAGSRIRRARMSKEEGCQGVCMADGAEDELRLLHGVDMERRTLLCFLLAFYH